MQNGFFDEALGELEANADLLDQILKITSEGDALHVQRYQLPEID
jgi:hypothetical protein